MYYAVNLMYKSERTDSNPVLWEERIILVSALDETEAESKALQYSKIEEAQFNTTDSVKVSWKFAQIERVHAIDGNLEDGVELFSRFLRNSEAESILTPFED